MIVGLSLPLSTWRSGIYLIAIVGFILALKGLSSPRHARRGNLVGAAAAVLAIAITFSAPTVDRSGRNLALSLVAMALGTAVAVPAARMVKMTAMPQMVAIFNGVGGGAAALISVGDLPQSHSVGGSPATYGVVEAVVGIPNGSVSLPCRAAALANPP